MHEPPDDHIPIASDVYALIRQLVKDALTDVDKYTSALDKIIYLNHIIDKVHLMNTRLKDMQGI